MTTRASSKGQGLGVGRPSQRTDEEGWWGRAGCLRQFRETLPHQGAWMKVRAQDREVGHVRVAPGLRAKRKEVQRRSESFKVRRTEKLGVSKRGGHERQSAHGIGWARRGLKPQGWGQTTQGHKWSCLSPGVGNSFCKGPESRLGFWATWALP